VHAVAIVEPVALLVCERAWQRIMLLHRHSLCSLSELGPQTNLQAFYSPLKFEVASAVTPYVSTFSFQLSSLNCIFMFWNTVPKSRC